MDSGRKCHESRRVLAIVALASILVLAGLPILGQERVNWTPFLERLQEQPDQEALTELVIDALARFEQNLSVLDPSRTILACAGGGCLRPILLTPPNRLVAGQTRSGPSRSYNVGEIVGLIGGFGGTIARDLEGFFLLRATSDGSIGLLDAAGEEVKTFAAAHVDQVSVTPIPIPDPEGESLLLSSRAFERRIEIESPAPAVVVGGSRAASTFSIGRIDENGLFSGIIFSGDVPES